jgi:hypothetical protein
MCRHGIHDTLIISWIGWAAVLLRSVAPIERMRECQHVREIACHLGGIGIGSRLADALKLSLKPLAWSFCHQRI